MSVTELERPVQQDARIGIIDCDIHPYMKSPRDLDPYLSARWRKYLVGIRQVRLRPVCRARHLSALRAEYLPA